MNTYDIDATRARFPALAARPGETAPLVLDGPGGSQVPDTVPAAMAAYMLCSNANLGGAYDSSRATGELMDEARRAAADLYNADAGEIVFGPNATTLLFGISRAVARDWREGDEIVVTALDHHANVSPWVLAARDRGVTVRTARVNPYDCRLDVEHLVSSLGERTRLVAFTAASNTTGTLVDVADVVARVRSVCPKAITCIDAVHFAPHRRIDVRDWDCDLLVSSAYKYFGPHLGVLFGRADLLATMTPYKVSAAKDLDPNRWETGTQSFEALAGFIAAIDYLASLAPTGSAANTGRRHRLDAAFSAISRHERALAERFLARANELPGLVLIGMADPAQATHRTPTFAFRVNGAAPRDISTHLGSHGVRVGDGNFYAQGLYEQLDLADNGGVVRAGFMHYNTAEEVDRFFDILCAHPAMNREAA